MKKAIQFFTITACVLFTYLDAFSQFDERMERFQAQKVAFFTERMDLSSKEAEKFWPVYNDYNNRKEKLEEESRSLLRYMAKNQHNMSDGEIKESLDKYLKNQEIIHQLMLDYHKKYLEILPPAKVVRIYTTENMYRTFLLNQLRENRQDRVQRRF